MKTILLTQLILLFCSCIAGPGEQNKNNESTAIIGVNTDYCKPIAPGRDVEIKRLDGLELKLCNKDGVCPISNQRFIVNEYEDSFTVNTDRWLYACAFKH